jgi:hypothetical protein
MLDLGVLIQGRTRDESADIVNPARGLYPERQFGWLAGVQVQGCKHRRPDVVAVLAREPNCDIVDLPVHLDPGMVKDAGRCFDLASY